MQSLDDPVMGGKSSSSIGPSESGGALWKGEVITEGGGFCGNRVQVCCLLHIISLYVPYLQATPAKIW